MKEHLGWIRGILEGKEAEEARAFDLPAKRKQVEAWGIYRELEAKEEKKG